MTYTLKDLTAEEMNVLGAGLCELPLKVSGALFAKVKQQAQTQEVPAPQKPMEDHEAA